MRYLVEMVWASRSVLHGSGDLYDLVLVRWDRWREWSPWNCILLSKNEAKAHTELEDINKVSRTAGVPARLLLKQRDKYAADQQRFSEVNRKRLRRRQLIGQWGGRAYKNVPGLHLET